MNRYILSIIIPLYNSEKIITSVLDKYFSKCLFSNSNIEFLLIDDGSIDNTELVCKKYCLRNDNIRYFKKENEGVYSCRNYGIAKARGDFVFFHDHDDFLNIEELSNIVDVLVLHKSTDLFIFEVNRIDDDKIEKYVQVNEHLLKKEMSNRELVNSLLLTLSNSKQKKEIVSIVGCIWSCVIKKEFILRNELKFKKIINYEDDFLMMLDILLLYPRIKILKKCIYYWVNYRSSTSHVKKCDDSRFDKLLIFKKYLLEKIPSNLEIKDRLINNIFWGFVFDSLLDYCSVNNNDVLSFKKKIKEYNIRKAMISCIGRKMNYKKEIIFLLFKFRFYRILYYFFVKGLQRKR